MRTLLAATAVAATALAASGAAAAPAAAPAMRASVRIDDFAYKAATLRVHVGTRVTWRNVDQTNHTVTFRGRHGAPSSVDNLRQGARAARTFRAAGRFTYVCAFHPFMHGTVVVSR